MSRRLLVVVGCAVALCVGLAVPGIRNLQRYKAL